MGFGRKITKKTKSREITLDKRNISMYIIGITEPKGTITMKVNDIMTAIMDEKNISKAQLGRAVGIDQDKNPTDVINKRMKQKNISVNVLSEMLAALGYTLVVVPSGPKVRDGEYEVTINE